MGSGLQHRRPADPAADEPAAGSLRETLPGPSGLKPPVAGLATRLWRRLRLGLHLLQGVTLVLTAFPFAARGARQRMRQNWSRQLLALLGIDLRVHGAPPQGGCMLVANHVSWLDIFVINAVAPAAFVSKAEVRKWPAIGWLAARNDTVFLQRGSRGHARIVGAELARALGEGNKVAIFPEGTTTDGSHVRHFHAALLQAAIDTGHGIQPLALRYRDALGNYSRAPAYDGELSLLQSIANIVAEPSIIAEVNVLTPETADKDADRRTVANALHERIAAVVTAQT